MNKRKTRDTFRLMWSILFSWLYIPHFIIVVLIDGTLKDLIISDILAMSCQLNIKLPIILQLLYQLHINRYYRTLFYHRIGPVLSALIGWYRPGDKWVCVKSCG